MSYCILSINHYLSNCAYIRYKQFKSILGSPVILSKTVEEKDVSEQIGVAFYTRSSLISVRWQCSDELLNHSIFEQVSMELYIYNTQISLLAYKTSISTSSNQCSRDNVCICISNEYSVHCEKIFSSKGKTI